MKLTKEELTLKIEVKGHWRIWKSKSWWYVK